MLWVKDLIQSGTGWRIGNGLSIHIWDDNWLLGQICFKPYCKAMTTEDLIQVSQLIIVTMTWERWIVHSTFMSVDVRKDFVHATPTNNV